MVELDWDAERTDGVTLVSLYVTADDARRVRIENRLGGPVWPPRRRGQPAAGWDEDGFEGVVTQDERLAVGYATPAPPEDPPAAVVSDAPADPTASAGPAGTRSSATAATASVPPPNRRLGRRTAADGGAGPGESDDGTVAAVNQTPAGVVRSLGDPTVPRDAVPTPETVAPATREQTGVSYADDDRTGATGPQAGTRSPGADVEAKQATDPQSVPRDQRDANPQSDEMQGDASRQSEGTEVDAPPVDAALAIPGPVRSWLRDVKRRLDAVERRGARPPRAGPLADSVAVDRRALEHVAAQAEALTDRAHRLEDSTADDCRPEPP